MISSQLILRPWSSEAACDDYRHYSENFSQARHQNYIHVAQKLCRHKTTSDLCSHLKLLNFLTIHVWIADEFGFKVKFSPAKWSPWDEDLIKISFSVFGSGLWLNTWVDFIVVTWVLQERNQKVQDVILRFLHLIFHFPNEFSLTQRQLADLFFS